VAISFHPPQGCIVRVDFDQAFKEPEMVKPRLCVVMSKPIQARKNLCTVIALSTTSPMQVMPYHVELTIPFQLPAYWTQKICWAKCDMVYAAGFHRIDLLRLGKQGDKRIYQTKSLPTTSFQEIQRAMLHGLGLSNLTKHL
jgi:mRNA interferase MazF